MAKSLQQKNKEVINRVLNKGKDYPVCIHCGTTKNVSKVIAKKEKDSYYCCDNCL